jgi:hypothetical protein
MLGPYRWKKENLVPHRRRTALALALVASSALAGCSGSIEIPAGSVQAPVSIQPIPSASRGVPKYVCTAVYQILTDGAVKLAGYVDGTGDKAKQSMRDAFADMSTKVSATGAETTDVELQRATAKISASLSAASQAGDPAAYVNGDFQTVGQNLDGACQ